MNQIARISPAFAVIFLLACGGSQDEVVVADAASPTRDAAPPAPASGQPDANAPAAFTEADLDAYERGMTAEIEIIKAAQQRQASAKTPEERSQAMQAQWDDQSAPAAAKAAGIDPDRYRRTRDAVHHVLQTLDFQGKIDGPMSMDLSRASEETKARLARDAYDTLTPEAANALRARLDRLVTQWSEHVRLTAVGG